MDEDEPCSSRDINKPLRYKRDANKLTYKEKKRIYYVMRECALYAMSNEETMAKVAEVFNFELSDVPAVARQMINTCKPIWKELDRELELRENRNRSDGSNQDEQARLHEEHQKQLADEEEILQEAEIMGLTEKQKEYLRKNVLNIEDEPQIVQVEYPGRHGVPIPNVVLANTSYSKGGIFQATQPSHARPAQLQKETILADEGMTEIQKKKALSEHRRRLVFGDYEPPGTSASQPKMETSELHSKRLVQKLAQKPVIQAPEERPKESQRKEPIPAKTEGFHLKLRSKKAEDGKPTPQVLSQPIRETGEFHLNLQSKKAIGEDGKQPTVQETSQPKGINQEITNVTSKLQSAEIAAGGSEIKNSHTRNTEKLVKLLTNVESKKAAQKPAETQEAASKDPIVNKPPESNVKVQSKETNKGKNEIQQKAVQPAGILKLRDSKKVEIIPKKNVRFPPYMGKEPIGEDGLTERQKSLLESNARMAEKIAKGAKDREAERKEEEAREKAENEPKKRSEIVVQGGISLKPEERSQKKVEMDARTREFLDEVEIENDPKVQLMLELEAKGRANKEKALAIREKARQKFHLSLLSKESQNKPPVEAPNKEPIPFYLRIDGLELDSMEEIKKNFQPTKTEEEKNQPYKCYFYQPVEGEELTNKELKRRDMQAWVMAKSRITVPKSYDYPESTSRHSVTISSSTPNLPSAQPTAARNRFGAPSKPQANNAGMTENIAKEAKDREAERKEKEAREKAENEPKKRSEIVVQGGISLKPEEKSQKKVEMTEKPLTRTVPFGPPGNAKFLQQVDRSNSVIELNSGGTKDQALKQELAKPVPRSPTIEKPKAPVFVKPKDPQPAKKMKLTVEGKGKEAGEAAEMKHKPTAKLIKRAESGQQPAIKPSSRDDDSAPKQAVATKRQMDSQMIKETNEKVINKYVARSPKKMKDNPLVEEENESAQKKYGGLFKKPSKSAVGEDGLTARQKRIMQAHQKTLQAQKEEESRKINEKEEEARKIREEEERKIKEKEQKEKEARRIREKQEKEREARKIKENEEKNTKNSLASKVTELSRESDEKTKEYISILKEQQHRIAQHKILKLGIAEARKLAMKEIDGCYHLHQNMEKEADEIERKLLAALLAEVTKKQAIQSRLHPPPQPESQARISLMDILEAEKQREKEAIARKEMEEQKKAKELKERILAHKKAGIFKWLDPAVESDLRPEDEPITLPMSRAMKAQLRLEAWEKEELRRFTPEEMAQIRIMTDEIVLLILQEREKMLKTRRLVWPKEKYQGKWEHLYRLAAKSFSRTWSRSSDAEINKKLDKMVAAYKKRQKKKEKAEKEAARIMNNEPRETVEGIEGLEYEDEEDSDDYDEDEAKKNELDDSFELTERGEYFGRSYNTDESLEKFKRGSEMFENYQVVGTVVNKKADGIPPKFIPTSLVTSHMNPSKPYKVSIDLIGRPKPRVYIKFAHPLSGTNADIAYDIYNKRSYSPPPPPENPVDPEAYLDHIVVKVEELNKEKNLYRANFIFDYFSPYESGKYTLMADNKVGVKARTTFSLAAWEDLKDPKLRIIKGPMVNYLGDGLYKLSVFVWSMHFQNVKWTRFKKSIECGFGDDVEGENPRIRSELKEINEFFYEFLLFIRDVTAQDKGIYRATISDEWGSVYCDFPLQMCKGRPEGRPSLYSQPKFINLKNDGLVMGFIVRTPVEPNFCWLLPNGERLSAIEISIRVNMSFDARPLTLPDGDLGYEGRLVFEHWFPAIKGRYICVVENIYGALEVRFELKEPIDSDEKLRQAMESLQVFEF